MKTKDKIIAWFRMNWAIWVAAIFAIIFEIGGVGFANFFANYILKFIVNGAFFSIICIAICNLFGYGVFIGKKTKK